MLPLAGRRYTRSVSSRAMISNACVSSLSDRELHAAYESARAKLSPSMDPDERVRVWQEIWALSGERERRQPPIAEPITRRS